MRVLPGQYAYLSDPAPVRLFRGPQQAIGKTWAGILDIIGHATGLHRWADPSTMSPDPIEAWAIMASWSQSVAVQAKIWELVPKDLLHPETRYDQVRGFIGKNPAFRIKHVPSGGWSVVRIKTTGQDTLDLASASITVAWFDEPPRSERQFHEVLKRTLKAGRYGRVGITCTPVNAKVDWLEKMAGEGRITDHHHRLEPHELIPVGYERPITLTDGTVCDQAWIDSIIAATPPHEVPVTCHGEWRMADGSLVFSSFSWDMVSPEPPEADVDLFLGIDHGQAEFAQQAILTAVEWRHGEPYAYVAGQYVAHPMSSEEDDADGILSMLEGLGLRWCELTEVYGDIPYQGSSKLSRKDNAELTRALARHPRADAHGIRTRVYPIVGRAKQGMASQPGAVRHGCRTLHRMMHLGRFRVSPACDRLIHSIRHYDGTSNSAESHAIDALRYSLRRVLYASSQDGPIPRVRAW